MSGQVIDLVAQLRVARRRIAELEALQLEKRDAYVDGYRDGVVRGIGIRCEAEGVDPFTSRRLVSEAVVAS